MAAAQRCDGQARRGGRCGPLLLAFALASAQDAAVLAPCDPGNASQSMNFSPQYGGVISSATADLCLCSLPGNVPLGALTFQQCDGPGAGLHNQEIGYNATAPGPIQKAGTGLCVTAAESGNLALAECGSDPASQAWEYSAATHQFSLSSNASQCMTIAEPPPPPPPLLSSVFGSGMVLQRDVPVSLWGWTTAGEVVTLIVAEPGGRVFNVTSAPAGADGRWNATLPASPASSSGIGVNITAVDAAGAQQALINVLFGDVIWCSGQSNMSGGNTPVSYAYNATAEIAASAGYPWVRVFTVGTRSQGSPTPLDELQFAPYIPWSVAGPNPVARFSASCWFHGKGLADALGPAVPLGLVESAWGGTSIQVWEPPGIVAACGDAPSYPGGWPTATTCLWNSMTVPFAGMRVAGIVWYQGESNAMVSTPEADYYACALPFLVAGLRAVFNSPAAHASVVQLAPWASSPASINAQTGALRNAQLLGGDAPNISVITAVDGGDPFGPIGSIHPRAKQLVGRRTAAAALTTVYDIPTAFSGPRYASAVSGGGTAGSLSATVTFSGVGPGHDGPLVVVTPNPVGPLANSSVCPVGVNAILCEGFMIQASDGTWYAAGAATSTASPSSVILTAPAAPAGLTAIATASGWSLWPITLLYSAGGLPAFPWNATL